MGFEAAIAVNHRRSRCAVGWAGVTALATFGVLADQPGWVLLAWAAALVLMVVTRPAARPGAEESLERPRVYRAAAALLLVVAGAGVVLGLLPDASGWSRWFAPFFGLVALLAYRAVVARGPRPAMLAATVSFWTWLPFGFVTLLGCKEPPFAPSHWTEAASQLTLTVTLLSLGLVAAAALASFRRPTHALPPARTLG
jgi:hypothetical protein